MDWELLNLLLSRQMLGRFMISSTRPYLGQYLDPGGQSQTDLCWQIIGLKLCLLSLLPRPVCPQRRGRNGSPSGHLWTPGLLCLCLSLSVERGSVLVRDVPLLERWLPLRRGWGYPLLVQLVVWELGRGRGEWFMLVLGLGISRRTGNAVKMSFIIYYGSLATPF